MRERARRGRWASLGLLAALVLWTAAPLVVLALRAHARGRVFVGAEAPIMFDELQYFAWIREAGAHVLAGNLFRLGHSERVFADPAFLLAGGLHRAGLSVPLAYLALAPPALAATWLGPLAWARRRIGDPAAAALAVALGLFYWSPLHLLVHWTHVASSATDASLRGAAAVQFPASLAWGVFPFVLAIGLVPVAFVCAEIALDASGRRERLRWLAASAAAALVASWVHPWQGEQTALACIGAIAVGGARRRHLPLLVPAAAAALPIVYYAVLSRADFDWEFAHRQAQTGHLALWALAVTAAPLLALAALGVRRPRGAAGEALLLAFPVAAVVAFLVTPSVPSHALLGAGIALAILAVRGWRRIGWRLSAGVAAAALATLPGMAYAAHLLNDAYEAGTQPYFLTHSERDALRYLERVPGSGGVLARTYLGAVVPSFTGRSTWVGHATWTPDFLARAREAEQLVGGGDPAPYARVVVRASGARFVVSDCEHGADLERALAPLLEHVVHFGCATVYVIRGVRD